ncbi:MAG: hypothetical protein Q8M43_08965 [Sulfuricurvum sp.]|uniref:hypothetical protein n=1 Tax=Sulfuricurvum sp. TaxID=2025608 RepID=UPI00273371AC|nr:hypothetical protein [Sulfuricurvum sp.]MDP3292149.1 hypothetical protein [Sulfuricurvum sp.]
MSYKHDEGFEEKAKYKEALNYMLGLYSGVQTAHLKHILRIFDPELVDRIINSRKECIRTLEYTSENTTYFTKGKSYQSRTFNGSTYEIIDDNGEIALIGCSYFDWIEK